MHRPSPESRRSTLVRMVGAALTFVSLAGCNLFGDGELELRVVWSEGPSPSESVSRGLAASDFPETTQAISDYYSTLGSVVGTYTPSSFKVPLVDVVLLSTDGHSVIYSALSGTEVDEDDIYADFTSGVDATDITSVEATTYNGFFVVIDPMNTTVSGGSHEDGTFWEFQEVHEIDVTIPGYTDAHFDIDTINDFPERTYLGSNSFRFSFYELHPDPIKTPGANYLFTDAASSSTAVLGGQDGLPSEFPLPQFANSSSDYFYFDTEVDVAFLSPFQQVDLSEASSATITVNLDLTDMITVYDAGTPLDNSDDIVLFSPDFWTRFSLSIESE